MTHAIEIPIVCEPGQLPTYARQGDAGADLRSAEELLLGPGERAVIRTGVRIELPEGHAAFVVPRSGLAARHGITVLNAPGTVDSGYRGEIMVPLINTDAESTFEILVGDRIAQLIVMPVAQARFLPVDELAVSERGARGFGSTGVRNSESSNEGESE